MSASTVPEVENCPWDVGYAPSRGLVEFRGPLTKVIPVIGSGNTAKDARAIPVTARGMRHHVVTIADDTGLIQAMAHKQVASGGPCKARVSMSGDLRGE